MPITAYLTVHPETNALEVFKPDDQMPTGREWAAVRFEIDDPEDGGEQLTWYVARTKALAVRIGVGRAVFVEEELRAHEAQLRAMSTAEKHGWVRFWCTTKIALGPGAFMGPPLPCANPPQPGDPMVVVRFIGHDGEEIDPETLEPVPRKAPPTTQPPAARPAPLPEDLL